MALRSAHQWERFHQSARLERRVLTARTRSCDTPHPRATGSRTLVLVAGIAHANDLSGRLAHAPSDPVANLAASWPVYDINSCTAEVF
ncbi:hypothetical protein [Streptomyces sp. SP17BM10]|uniref:hypothetical protein n=1 Tax=Streptomyces sp. SP17BM10 TaxID=3002530 RepID=UPI002E79DBFD|nr:hypothetical protein [Streptomyces sp. SP17BM10]